MPRFSTVLPITLPSASSAGSSRELSATEASQARGRELSRRIVGSLRIEIAVYQIIALQDVGDGADLGLGLFDVVGCCADRFVGALDGTVDIDVEGHVRGQEVGEFALRKGEPLDRISDLVPF